MLIRCYLFECWKLIQPKVVLKLRNLRKLADQYESLLWGKKIKLVEFSDRLGGGREGV